jgi:LemA protein
MPIVTIISALLLVTIFVVLIMSIGIYNRLITLRNRFKNAWSQIDVQLKRRYDLIPNLVESAQAFLTHERETLEAVLKARASAVTAGARAAAHPEEASNISQLASAETVLGGALGRLLAVVESYPDLRGNENIAQLMEELSSTENKIAFARQAFNDSVMTYNTSREVFPNVIFARVFNFQAAEFFELDSPPEKIAPKVSFKK